MRRVIINQKSQQGNTILGETVYYNSSGQPEEKRAQEAISQKKILDNKKIFIAHGHDELSRYKLKEYLQNTLHYPEPVILSDIAGKGRTILESFEEEAENAGVVFVLVTPDDFVNDSQMRARQNVIFELGYFMGKLGRKSGRVIVLQKGSVEIPSDLNGILYINIDHGIQEAGEQIRKALEAVE